LLSDGNSPSQDQEALFDPEVLNPVRWKDSLEKYISGTGIVKKYTLLLYLMCAFSLTGVLLFFSSELRYWVGYRAEFYALFIVLVYLGVGIYGIVTLRKIAINHFKIFLKLLVKWAIGNQSQ